MGKKLNVDEIEQAIINDSNVMFDTCSICGGVEEYMSMHPVDDSSFDVYCDECDKEVFMTFESSWGYISVNKNGNVLEIDGDEEISGERNYLYDIAKFNIEEYLEYLNKINKDLEWSSDDILIIGFWNKNGDYNEPEKEWRYNNSEEE